jgi:hypothetical protein
VKIAVSVEPLAYVRQLADRTRDEAQASRMRDAIRFTAQLARGELDRAHGTFTGDQRAHVQRYQAWTQLLVAIIDGIADMDPEWLVAFDAEHRWGESDPPVTEEGRRLLGIMLALDTSGLPPAT